MRSFRKAPVTAEPFEHRPRGGAAMRPGRPPWCSPLLDAASHALPQTPGLRELPGRSLRHLAAAAEAGTTGAHGFHASPQPPPPRPGLPAAEAAKG